MTQRVHHNLHRPFRDASAPPAPRVDFIHRPGCHCPECAAFEPAVQPTPRALTFVELGWLALAGVVVGSAIAFAIDAHGAWHALASCFGGR